MSQFAAPDRDVKWNRNHSISLYTFRVAFWSSSFGPGPQCNHGVVCRWLPVSMVSCFRDTQPKREPSSRCGWAIHHHLMMDYFIPSRHRSGKECPTVRYCKDTYSADVGCRCCEFILVDLVSSEYFLTNPYQISSRERTDCEIFYLSHIARAGPASDDDRRREHPQWDALCKSTSERNR